MKSKDKRNARKGKQRVAKRYSKAREDAQLLGIIETTPAEAVSNEVVDPMTQGSQPLPELVGQAVRNGWATPEAKKPQIIDELVKMVEETDLYPGFRLQAASVLQRGDKDQWERDNPDLAGKTRGGGTKVNVLNEVNVQNNLFQEMLKAATAQPVVTVEQEIEQKLKDPIVTETKVDEPVQ